MYTVSKRLRQHDTHIERLPLGVVSKGKQQGQGNAYVRFRCVVFSCFSKKSGPVHICPCRPVLVLPPRRYLEEVGYTDTILDMRSKRVRSLLGRSLELNGAAEPSEGGPRAPPAPGGLSSGESLLVKQIEEQIKR